MRGSNVLKILLFLLVFSFVAHQIYSSVYKPITTENVNYYEAVEGLNITGVIMRKEYLVESNTDGVYHFLLDDGARVAKGGLIANIYSDTNASVTMSRIAELEKQLGDFTALQNYNNQQAADLDLVNNRVNEAIDGVIKIAGNGQFNDMNVQLDELLSFMNRRRMLTGEQTDFSSRISELNDEIKNLKSSLPNAKGTIKAVQSGYFSSTVDGYESVLDCSDLSKITVDFLDGLTAKQTDKNVVGKIVSDYEWYIAAKVSLNDSKKYKQGEKLTIKTFVRSNPELEVEVETINLHESSDSAVVVFSCDQMSRELAEMRTGPMTVVNAVHSGLKDDKRALRVVDSQTGVYVISGITLDFVTVKVLYSNDDYMICEQTQSNDKVLRLYDEVVVKGRKLYDGKIVG